MNPNNCTTAQDSLPRSDSPPRPLQHGPAEVGPGPESGFASVLDAVTDTFVAVDHRWRFAYLNRHTLQALGKTADELLGQCMWEAYPAFRSTTIETTLRRAMSERVAVRFEMPDPVGTAWQEVNVYPSPGGLVIHGRDVTDRKRAELALSASEELSRRVIEAVPGGLVKVSLEGAIVQANQAAQRILGLSYDELTHRYVTDFRDETIWEDGSPCSIEDYPVTRCLRTGLPQPAATIGVRRGDGSIAWAIYTAVPLLDPTTRQVTSAVVTFIDISKRKRAEEALRQSEERFQQAAKAVDALIYEFDLQTGVVYRSPGMEAVIGFKPDEVPATAEWWHRRAHPDDLPSALASLEKALASEEGFDIEYRILHRGGDYVHVWDRGRIVRDSQGRAIRIVGCSVNHTQRKRAETALRESEELHRLLSELTSDYTFTCRVDADGTIRMESATAGFTRITGFTVEEAEAHGGWTSFIHPADLPAALNRMAPLLAGQRHESELRILTKTGQSCWIRYSIHPIWDNTRKRVVRMLGAAQDISGRKKAEAQLQEYAERLQSLSRRLLEVQEIERRSLARELHDEIGQDLTGLKLTLESCATQQGEELRATLAKAQAQVRESTAHVRDLSLHLRPTMLDDLGLLPALVWLLQRYMAQTRVRVRFRHNGLGGRYRPEVETAAYRIVQEALTNVARHSGAGEAAVDVWRRGDLLCLKVEDEGTGFDLNAVHQAGPSSGLSSMQERAVLLGGRLLLKAEPGTGTCLIAELPLLPKVEKPIDETKAAAGR